MKELIQKIYKESNRYRAIPASCSGEDGVIFADFLECDIQNVPMNIKIILEEIKSVSGKNKSMWARVGNNYALEIRESKVVIKDLYSDGPTRQACIDLAQFEHGIRLWSRAIGER